MKGYAYCTKCKKIVEIAELYISNTVLNVLNVDIIFIFMLKEK